MEDNFDNLVVQNIRKDYSENVDEQLVVNNESQTSLEITSGYSEVENEFHSIQDEQLMESLEHEVKTELDNFEVDEENVLPSFIKCDSSEISTNVCERTELKNEVKDEIDPFQDVKIEIEDYSVSPETLKDIVCHGVNFEEKLNAFYIKSQEESTNSENVIEPKVGNTQPYECTECNYTTIHKKYLTRHSKIHNKHELEKFFCDLCTYNTIHKNSLKFHKQKHSSIKSHQCKVCQKHFKHKVSLKLHMNDFHPEECPEKMERFKCDQCPYSSLRYNNLKNHQIKHGVTEKLTKYNCANCEYTTYHKHHLKVHVITHTGERPFNCDYCQHTCATRSQLKEHLEKTPHFIRKLSLIDNSFNKKVSNILYVLSNFFKTCKYRICIIYLLQDYNYYIYNKF